MEIAVSFGIEKCDVEKRLKICNASFRERERRRRIPQKLGVVPTKSTVANGLPTKVCYSWPIRTIQKARRIQR